ncbi:MAG: hypothetical protein AB1758_00075 [Candidatus Eremiobacterota bacterium]
MSKPPYRSRRQEWVGEKLDLFQSQGLLRWRFDWDDGMRGAIYWIQFTGQVRERCDTRRAERYVQQLCDEQGIVWCPVKHPGGPEQLAEAMAWVEARERELKEAADQDANLGNAQR